PERPCLRRTFESQGDTRAILRFARLRETPWLRARETMLPEWPAIRELRKDDGNAAADRPPRLERTALADVQAFFATRRCPRDELRTLERRDSAGAVAASPPDRGQSVVFEEFGRGHIRSPRTMAPRVFPPRPHEAHRPVHRHPV